jgi:hypothetical protein
MGRGNFRDPYGMSFAQEWNDPMNPLRNGEKYLWLHSYLAYKTTAAFANMNRTQEDELWTLASSRILW